jgi:protein-disulfide isomerase
LFALANAGIEVRDGFLGHALTSPVTFGVVVGSVLGKPLGVIGGTWLVSRLDGGRARPPVGWGALSGGGTIAGIGFTVSLLISSVAFSGEQLQDAKLGVLISAVCASLLTWLVFRAISVLPKNRRALALLGTSASIIDLQVPVEPGRDHVRGPERALVTVVEYGDFECPYCGRAEPAVRELLEDFGDVRYVWRHLPLTDVHPHAQKAAEAAEAAAAQGAFWAMHDQLLDHQQELGPAELMGHAAAIGIDTRLFADSLRHHAGTARIAEDIDGADLSGVTGTPTFFVNGHRHYGSFDVSALAAAVQTARARALVAVPPSESL